MFREVRQIRSARRRRSRLRAFLLVAGAVAVVTATAAPAQAATHEYCNWDGSFVTAPTVWALCAEPGAHYITQNYAHLPYGEGDTSIYCSASLGGTQYGSANVGNPGCYHTYSGANNLTAFMYVGPVSHAIHGSITY